MTKTKKYKCGCPVVTPKKGPSRALLLANASERECVEHYKIRRAAETVELALQYPDLPPLVGSPNQIAWANQIRLTLIHALAQAIEKAENPTEKRGNLGAHINKQIAGRAVKDRAKLDEYSAETDAQYFINRKFLQRKAEPCA